MRGIRIALGIMFTLFTLHSCTIEKRRYTSGFHVEWKHDCRPVIATAEQKTIPAIQEITLPVTVTVNPIPETIVEDDDIQASAEEAIPALIPLKRISQDKENVSVSQGSSEETDKENSEGFKRKKRKTNSKFAGRMSAILGVLAWVLLGINVSMALNGATLASIALLSLISFLLALNAFIFGIRALRASSKGKSKKANGRTAAIIGTVLGGIYLLLSLVSAVMNL